MLLCLISTTTVSLLHVATSLSWPYARVLVSATCERLSSIKVALILRNSSPFFEELFSFLQLTTHLLALPVMSFFAAFLLAVSLVLPTLAPPSPLRSISRYGAKPMESTSSSSRRESPEKIGSLSSTCSPKSSNGMS